jgi:hypothetical protein
MLGLISYITSSSSAPHSLTVLYTTLCYPHLNVHPLPGTPLHRRIRPNSKELKKFYLVPSQICCGCLLQ